MQRFVTLSFGLLALCGASPALAGLTICNKTPHTVRVATAWFPYDEEGTSTNQHMGGTISGWYDVAPGACDLVTTQPARDGQFYYYARTLSEDRREWTSRSMLCVRNKRFNYAGSFLMGDQGCEEGWRPLGFKATNQVDTVEQRVNLLW